MTHLVPLPNPPAPTPGAGTSAFDSREDLIPLKRLIFLYLFLLVFEGALRKWILPGLANPLLIIRDPLIILIYVVAFTVGVFPKNAFIVWIFGMAVVTALVSEIAGQGNFLITCYGLRTDFLHLPLIFLMPNVLNSQDVHRIGRWLLIIALPMSVLVVAQFRAPPESLLNVGVGGSIGSQLEVSFGKIRPPGTFSFNTGLVDFVALITAYLVSTLMQKRSANTRLALIALPSVVIMVAVSGSRASLGALLIICTGVVFICLRKPVFFGNGIKGLLAVGVVFFALSFWSEFRTGLQVHGNRLETGGGLQDGLILRIVHDATAPVYAIAETPVFGKGLGMGTNVAAGLLFGERSFLLAEGEWERVVRESGPILGFAFIGLRFAILIYIFRRAMQALDHENTLPLIVFCAAFPEVLNGQFSVPTSLGCAVFRAGYCLAAAKVSGSSEASDPPPPSSGPASSSPKVRGRSIYSEQLHGS